MVDSSSLLRRVNIQLKDKVERLRGALLMIASGVCAFPGHKQDGSNCKVDCARFIAKRALEHGKIG